MYHGVGTIPRMLRTMASGALAACFGLAGWGLQVAFPGLDPFWGRLALALSALCLLTAVACALAEWGGRILAATREVRHALSLQHIKDRLRVGRTSVWPAIGMMVGGFIFVLCAAW